MPRIIPLTDLKSNRFADKRRYSGFDAANTLDDRGERLREWSYFRRHRHDTPRPYATIPATGKRKPFSSAGKKGRVERDERTSVNPSYCCFGHSWRPPCRLPGRTQRRLSNRLLGRRPLRRFRDPSEFEHEYRG